MKKIISLVLVFVLVFAVASVAFAAGRPSFTKQPETATTDNKGKVSFSIKTNPDKVKAITWKFVNPETGEEYTGKTITKAFKGLKVSGPNKKTITLKNVPEGMHGWTVYVKVNNNGYHEESEKVKLYVYGMDVPEESGSQAGEAPAPEEQPAAAPEPEAPAETEPAPEATTEAEPAPEAEPAAETAPAEAEAETQAANLDEGPSNADYVPQSFTVTANADVLYKPDDPDHALSSIEFSGTGSFIVASEEPIVSWAMNGIRFEPAEPVKQIKITNVSSDLSLDVRVRRASAAETVVDESNMCKVSCTGCKFSYNRGGLRSVTEGEVPAGARISVIAENSDLAGAGYSINGADPVNAGKTSFQLEITGDTTIVCAK